VHFQPKECKSDEYQKTIEEAETRLLAKRRKEAMKKKQLNLWLLFFFMCVVICTCLVTSGESACGLYS